MKKLFVLLLLCVGFNAYAQQNSSVTFYSEYCQYDNDLYKRYPVYISFIDKTLIISSVKDDSVFDKYYIVKSTEVQMKNGPRIDILAVNANYDYVHIYLIFNNKDKEICLALKEDGLVFRDLRQL